MKIGYYLSPTTKVQGPFSLRIVPLFDAAVMALGGSWKECWSNSDESARYGVYKIGVPDETDLAAFTAGGVAFLANNFADAVEAAGFEPKIGAASAARMVDQSLAGEAMEANSFSENQ